MKICMAFLFWVLISGCANTIFCRHEVMREVAWAIENKKDVYVAVYEIDHNNYWNGHAQAVIPSESGWKYLSIMFGMVVIKDMPEYPVKRITVYRPEDYLKALREIK